ncbi:uncharacterized protein N0V89_000323 [Didymosphaeria variabile]|uniref:Uncharacterized protein n=1 Tax=Didymosphaeria variabile TaxID=1932322 RepID=A0A9W8XU26_9PLEO|nr:uncharacterized protein N0V89_000323 [Didymosphaeria variabile]KAJ4359767.1 hypothetical protein N0V89_000323 [Didymosphaeria variabile]
MKYTITLFTLAASVLSAPVAQSSYDDYGSYNNIPAPAVENPPAPAAGYGSYGDYNNVPAPAGGYATYGAYKRDVEKEVKA